jgi:hypothetical protein
MSERLPRFEKKLLVALHWTLDLIFSKDLVQFQTLRTKGISHKESEYARLEKATTWPVGLSSRNGGADKVIEKAS